VPILQHNDKFVQIQSRSEAGKKDLGPNQKVWIEPDMLYPLLKGAGDFESCYVKLSMRTKDKLIYTLVPNHGIGKEEYAKCKTLLDNPSLSKTKNWFYAFKGLLENRSTYRLQMKGAPFYAIYNIGEYTFKPWKVIWPEMSSKFYAAVVGSADVPVIGRRPYIPDHKVYYVAFDEKEPAYFLCGLLNTNTVKEWIESHTISIQVGDVFKHMQLPEYNVKNKDYKQLASLVEQAHYEHDKIQREKIVEAVRAQGEIIIESWASARFPKN
jgi:hypothetical protein